MNQTQPFFNAIQDSYGLDILKKAKDVNIPSDTTIFRQGDTCNNFLLVLNGSVKVFSRAENGREVILYHVRDGESCTLTTSCLFADNLYPAEGITETQTHALMIPRDEFQRGLQFSDTFRQAIFDGYGQRLSDVICLVENISFGQISVRLARLLLQKTSRNNLLNITHQALAAELASSREVISRQLKILEKKACLKLHRGNIEIIDIALLEAAAQQ